MNNLREKPRKGLLIWFKFPDAIITTAELISDEPGEKREEKEIRSIDLRARFFEKALVSSESVIKSVKVHFDSHETISFNDWFNQKIGDSRRVIGFSCQFGTSAKQYMKLLYKETI